MNRPAIMVRGVSKRYGDLVAVDAVTLDVEPGEIYALLGLNGAGKTTLIRMLLGMIRTAHGRIEIDGHPVTDRVAWSRVGYLVEEPSAYPELTVRENLEVVRRLRKILDPAATDRSIDLLGLRPYAARRARALSTGNAQRLGLAKALLHQPDLLVLDEPINGLDPAGVVEIRSLLVDLRDGHGVTVLLSSHLLAEVARVASKIGVLHHGRLIDELDPGDLTSRTRTHLEVSTRDTARAARVLRAAGLDVQHTSEDLVVGDVWAVHHPDEVAAALVRAGEPPTRLAVIEEDLETYFLRLVGSIPPEAAEAPSAS